MAYKDMFTIDRDDTGSSAWFHTTLTISGGTYSDTYRLPIQAVAQIGAYVTGSGYLEFSLDSLVALDAGSAVFDRWDGVAQINPAVTGFRLARDAGIVTAGVVVKTLSAS